MTASFFKIITVLSVGISLWAIMRIRQPKQEQNFDGTIIHTPKGFVLLGFFCLALSVFISYQVVYYGEPDADTMVGYGLAIISFITGILTLRKVLLCFIYLDEDEMRYITLFGRSYTIKYTEIKGIRLSEFFFTIKTADKTFFGDPYAENWDIFFDKLGDDFDDFDF